MRQGEAWIGRHGKLHREKKEKVGNRNSIETPKGVKRWQQKEVSRYREHELESKTEGKKKDGGRERKPGRGQPLRLQLTYPERHSLTGCRTASPQNVTLDP